MLTGLQDEITSRTDLATASKERIMQLLNEDGSALSDTWAPIDVFVNPIRISKNTVKATYLTMEQRKNLRDMLASADTIDASDALKDFADLYKGDDVFFVNHPTFRSMLDTLGVALSIDPAVITEIKRLGERKISRAEELFTRKITMEDFE